MALQKILAIPQILKGILVSALVVFLIAVFDPVVVVILGLMEGDTLMVVISQIVRYIIYFFLSYILVFAIMFKPPQQVNEATQHG